MNTHNCYVPTMMPFRVDSPSSAAAPLLPEEQQGEAEPAFMQKPQLRKWPLQATLAFGWILTLLLSVFIGATFAANPAGGSSPPANSLPGSSLVPHSHHARG